MRFLTLNGEEIALIVAPPNRAAPPKLTNTLPFTDVKRSLSARESRRTFGRSARYALEYTPRFRSAQASTEFRLGLVRLKTQPVAVPLWDDGVALSAAVAAGANQLPKATTDYPVRSGAEWIVLNADGSLYEIVVVSSIIPAQLNLSGVTANAWPAGTMAYPLLFGRFAERPKLDAITPSTITGPLKIIEDSPYARRLNAFPAITLPTVGAGVTEFSSTPLWTLEPHWSGVLDTTEVDIIYHSIGFGRQSQTQAYPQPVRRGLEMEFICRSRAAIAFVEQMFADRRGPLRPFMMPTFRNDLVLTNALPAGEIAQPNALSGLKFWLKADALALADGATVGSWSDVSGNGNHAVQATDAYKPIFKTGILNGQPVVRFDGANDYLSAPNGALAAITTAATVLLVCQNAAPTVGVNTVFASNPAPSDNRFLAHLPYGPDGNWYFDLGNLSASGRVSAAWGGSATSFFLWEMLAGSSAMSLRRNGTLVASTSGSSSFSATGKTLEIGSGAFNGDIAEIIVYNRVLSDEERQQIERYLGAKYGIAVPTPANQITIAPSVYSSPDYAATHPGWPYLALVQSGANAMSTVTPLRITLIDGTSLTTQSAITVPHNPALTRMSHLPLLRFAEPELQWTYTGARRARCRVKLIEVPDEYATPNPDLPEPAYLYRFYQKLPGGTLAMGRYTSYENTITFGGNVWTPAPFSHGTIERTLNLEDKTELTSWDGNFPGNPIAKFLPFTLEADLWVEISEVNSQAPDDGTAEILFTGIVSQPKVSDGRHWVVQASLGKIVEGKFPRKLIQRTDNNIPFSAPTLLDRATFKEMGTIAVLSATSFIVDVTMAGTLKAANYYAGGELERGNGSTYEGRHILYSTPITGAQRLTLDRPLLVAAVGNSVDLYPGYNGSLQDCVARFANGINFGGYPFNTITGPQIKAVEQKAASGGKK